MRHAQVEEKHKLGEKVKEPIALETSETKQDVEGMIRVSKENIQQKMTPGEMDVWVFRKKNGNSKPEIALLDGNPEGRGGGQDQLTVGVFKDHHGVVYWVVLNQIKHSDTKTPIVLQPIPVDDTASGQPQKSSETSVLVIDTEEIGQLDLAAVYLRCHLIIMKDNQIQKFHRLLIDCTPLPDDDAVFAMAKRLLDKNYAPFKGQVAL